MDKVEFEKSMSVEVFVGISANKEKKKEKSYLKNRCETFRDNNHQSLCKNTKLYNDIDWNPGPQYTGMSYPYESTEYCNLQVLLSHKK